MIYYINPRGQEVDEFLAEKAEYVGMIGSPEGDNISSDVINLNVIEEKQKEGKFLVCSVMNSTWWIAFVFNTKDAAVEVKSKHKGKTILWYWMDKATILDVLPGMQRKEFEREFGE